MVLLGTLRELFQYNDWASDKLLAAATPLSDAQLDRRFEMGAGTLRETLNHLFAAERVWLDRWLGAAEPRFRSSAAGVTLSGLAEDFRTVAQERGTYLSQRADADLAKPLRFTDLKGEPFALPLGGLMLHVCNHGTHHRAQVLNMLRHVGAAMPKPGLDYIYMRLERPVGNGETPALDLSTIRTYFGFSDWARDQMHAAARDLPDAALDRCFELGVGTLRKTLLHILFAERWWVQNWTQGPGLPLPELPEAMGIADLEREFTQTAAARNSFIDRLSDADLLNPVEARPRPDVKRVFPIGVTMLQLCNHGTHHRAQALNMLRQVGAATPGLDIVLWLRQAGGKARA